ncbi:MAG: hypothetical protein NZ870_01285 [bacterium]|nr:hypothetical protein [bacterium]
MKALIIGIVFAVVGVLGIVYWIKDVVVVIKGSIPLFLLMGGVIAIVAGVSSIKEEKEIKTQEQPEKTS